MPTSLRPALRIIAASLALAAAGAAPAAARATAPVAVPSGPVSWVVGLDSASRADRMASALRGTGATVEPLRRLRAVVVTGGSRAEVVAALAAGGAVDYVEPQRPRHLLAEPADGTDAATGRPFDWAFDDVRAAGGLADAGGGAPDVPVAVVDTGVDRTHPDLAGRVLEGHDVLGTTSVKDVVGHGTFVAGLISAIDGNGAGGRGVAGATPIFPVRVSTTANITSADLAAGIVAAVDGGARVMNISIGGPELAQIERDALDYAESRDVLVVASAGNSARDDNEVEFPAAALGGEEGGWSAGLSVGATGPDDQPADFSTHNRNVSIAAPGAGDGPCTQGVYSTIPLGAASLWSGGPCDRIFTNPTHGAGRYAYGEGTSFSAPLVAGAAALVRHVAPGLRAPQVGDALRRSARQTLGTGWNEFTGAGVLDITAAVALARRYDLTPPTLSIVADESQGAVRVRASADDATAPAHELAGGADLAVALSRDGTAFAPLAADGATAIDRSFDATPAQPLWLRATSCDLNRNCATRTAGPFTGAPPAGPKAGGGSRTGAALARPRILGLGVTTACPRGHARCLRLAWRVGPALGRGVRYSVVLRQPGRREVLARVTGTAAAGRRHLVTLLPRRPLACGRAVARLTVRGGGRSLVVVRRAPVRKPCVRLRKTLT